MATLDKELCKLSHNTILYHISEGHCKKTIYLMIALPIIDLIRIICTKLKIIGNLNKNG